MSDTQRVSGAARQLAAQRWGARKPVWMARELAERVDELPEIERGQLLAALTQHTNREQSRDLVGRCQCHRLIQHRGQPGIEGGPVCLLSARAYTDLRRPAY